MGLWDCNKRFYILATRVLGEEKNDETGKGLKEIMAKNSSNMARDRNLHTQEAE